MLLTITILQNKLRHEGDAGLTTKNCLRDLTGHDQVC